MARISNDPTINAIKFDEGASDADTPASGDWRLYFKSGGLYYIEDNATVRQVCHTGAGAAAAVLTTGAVAGAAAQAQAFTFGISVATGGITLPVAGTSGAYTAGTAQSVILMSAAGTVTLPDAAGITGRLYHVARTGAGTVEVKGTGGDTISGAGTVSLAQWDAVQVVSDGTNWVKI